MGFWYTVVSGGLLLALDQWSKQQVRLHVCHAPVPWGPVKIRYATHVRTLYQRSSGRLGLVVIWFLSLGCAFLLLRNGLWFRSPTALVGLGLAFGGACGNLIDVLRHGHVINFVDLHWWPVFNLADLAIVAGLILAFLA